MYYKNYWINYIDIGEKFVIGIMDQDMSNFVNTKEDQDYMHLKRSMLIDRYKWENADCLLKKGELFMGIFPLDIINQSIKEWKDSQEKSKREIEESLRLECKKPIEESKFENFWKAQISLEGVIAYIKAKNCSCKKYWGYEFSIEEYYKDILIKYWGDYKL